MESKVRRGIGLVAHDAMKKDLIEWVLWNSELLMGNKFYCTGTTGTLILEALKEKHPDEEWDFTILKSGPLGGDQQMGSRIVDGQLKKYDLAKQYFEASSKWAFWKLQPKKFNTTNRIVEDSMIEYLTLQQTAYLLGLSAYNVRYLISKDVFHAVVEVRGKRTLYFIRADEIWCYVTEQMCQYSKAIEYFQCENSYAFWQKYEDDFKTNWINKYKERNQRYYGKKKIQKSTGRADETGGKGKRTSGKPEGTL